MNRTQEVLTGCAIALFGLAVIIGNAIAVTTNPLTWIGCGVGTLAGCLIAWYGWALIRCDD